MKILIPFVGIFLVVVGCTNVGATKKDAIDKEKQDDPTIPSLPIQEIQTLTAESRPFEEEFLLNGVIRAHERLEIQSEISGWLTFYNLREGDRLSKGSVIAKLDDSDIQVEIANRRVELEEADNKRKEQRMLVSGSDFGMDSTLTPQQIAYIDISTGYNRAVQALKSTEYRLTKTVIRTPISGVIADRKVQQGQWLNAATPICTVINPASFEAEFLVLENIVLQLRKNQKVAIEAMGDKRIQGMAKISSINPIVDKNGLVKVKARLLTGHNRYYEGMNITVKVKTQTPPYIIIPKEALVLRSGREVVFVYDPKDQLAKWKYVKVAHQNSTLIAISEGLDIGDQVIFDGNLNLSHDARVQLAQKQ